MGAALESNSTMFESRAAQLEREIDALRAKLVGKDGIIREFGMTQVRTAPYCPQSNGMIERWHETLKTIATRPRSQQSFDEAIRVVAEFVEHDNKVRLQCAIGLSRLQTGASGARWPSSSSAIASPRPPAPAANNTDEPLAPRMRHALRDATDRLIQPQCTCCRRGRRRRPWLATRQRLGPRPRGGARQCGLSLLPEAKE
ncbi:MAG: transposase [Deltaproteobacteria bacterium]|nr:transposase [Deltaproteobacteria bacterium]